MADRSELTEAISGFREAETALADLTRRLEEIDEEADRIATAHAALDVAAVQTRDLAKVMLEATGALRNVAETGEAAVAGLERADPARALAEIERTTSQVERLRSRLDEVSGELRAVTEGQGDRLASSVSAVSKAVATSVASTEQAIVDRLSLLESNVALHRRMAYAIVVIGLLTLASVLWFGIAG